MENGLFIQQTQCSPRLSKVKYRVACGFFIFLCLHTYTCTLVNLSGICDPQIIGDKAKWFADKLEPVVYQVFDSDSKIFKEPWIDVDYEPSIIFDEDEVTPNNDDDDDSSSCHSSVGDLVQKMISGGINGSTPAGPHLPPFAPMRASSPMPDVQASFTLPRMTVTKGNMLEVESIHDIRGSLTHKQ